MGAIRLETTHLKMASILWGIWMPRDIEFQAPSPKVTTLRELDVQGYRIPTKEAQNLRFPLRSRPGLPQMAGCREPGR